MCVSVGVCVCVCACVCLPAGLPACVAHGRVQLALHVCVAECMHMHVYASKNTHMHMSDFDATFMFEGGAGKSVV